MIWSVWMVASTPANLRVLDKSGTPISQRNDLFSGFAPKEFQQLVDLLPDRQPSCFLEVMVLAFSCCSQSIHFHIHSHSSHLKCPHIKRLIMYAK